MAQTKQDDLSRRINSFPRPRQTSGALTLLSLLTLLFRAAGLNAAGFPIQITELMYHPLDGEAFEFIEFQNTGTRPVDLSFASWDGIEFRFEDESFIQAGEIWVLASNDTPEAFQNLYPDVTPRGYFGKKLSNAGEAVRLSNNEGKMIAWAEYDDRGFWPQAADGMGYSLERVSLNALPNSPTAWRQSSEINGTPGTHFIAPSASEIRISEIYASSDPLEPGDVDFVELLNLTEQSIDLSGWHLTDSPDDLERLTLPTGTLIDASSHLVIFLIPQEQAADTIGTFGLNSEGETLFLFDADGYPIDQIRFGNQVPGHSLSRFEDQWTLSLPTPDAENQEAIVGDSLEIRINEWKADAESNDTDWIELYNPHTELPVSLAQLCLGHGSLSELESEEVPVAPFGAIWSIFPGTTAPTPDDPIAWTRIDYQPENWEELTAPFHFGTEFEFGTELSGMSDAYTSLLMRSQFDLLELNGFQTFRVKASTDDGFIAWINGAEWGRLHVPNTPATIDLVATSDGQGGITHWTFDFDAFGLYLKEGLNTLTVQAVSSRKTDEDFFMDFSLVGVLPPKQAFTIKASSPIPPLTFIPPKGFLRLDASLGTGVNDLQFRIPAEGTTLALLDSNDEILTTALVSIGSEGVSEGRFPDGAEEIVYFTGGDSPGRSNVTDQDEDQIPDLDEISLGLNPEDPNDANLDADNDGVSNRIEYLDGTDLNDPASFFALKIENVSPGGIITLSAPRLLNEEYTIETSHDLAAPHWAEMTQVSARKTEEPGSIQFDITIEHPAAFFRIAEIDLPHRSAPFNTHFSPANGSTDHLPDQPIVLKLADPIRPETIPGPDSWIVMDSFERPVPSQARYDAGFSQVTLRPDLPLANSSSYRVLVAPEITTISGQPLSIEIGDWHFQTRPPAPLVDDPSVYTQDNDGVIRLDVMVVEGETPYTFQDLLNDDAKGDEFDPIVRVRVEDLGGNKDQGANSTNASMKVRGATSRTATQKSFRIRLDPSANEWRGHDQINLMKHPFELTRVRNRLSFELFEQIPDITSLRTQYVHLFINGEDFGLFSQIEHYDEGFLRRHGLDPDAHLYKANFFEWFRYPLDLKLRSDLTYDEEAFETRLEIETRDDHEKLLRLLDDINDESLDFPTVFNRYFNRNNYLTWLAINLLTGNIDTNSQNFVLYSPTNAQTWYFLPWDYDGAWGLRRQPDNLRHEFPRWQEGLATYWNVSLHKRFLQIEQNRLDLEHKILELRSNQLSEDNVQSVLDRYRALVESFVSTKPDTDLLPVSRGEARTDPELKLAEWAGEYDRLPSELLFNETLYRQSLERPMPIFLGTPQQTTNALSFTWSESQQLEGVPVRYDFELSSSPHFGADQIIDQQLNLDRLSTDVTPLPSAGTYYFRIQIRNTADPSNAWQIPFTSFFDPTEGRSFYGMRSFTVD